MGVPLLCDVVQLSLRYLVEAIGAIVDQEQVSRLGLGCRQRPQLERLVAAGITIAGVYAGGEVKLVLVSLRRLLLLTTVVIGGLLF